MSICLSPGGPTIYSNQQLSDRLLVGTTKGVITIDQVSPGAWRKTGQNLEQHHICALLQEPTSGRFFAGSHDAGIAISDNGVDWRTANNGLTITNIYSLAFTQRNGKPVIYAGTEPAALFISEDLGENWTEIDTLSSASNADTWTFPAPPFLGHIKTITINQNNSDEIYLSIEQGGLYRTRDAGLSWTELTEGLPNDVHRMVMSPDRPDRLFVADGFFFNRSDDAGKTWFEMAELIPRIGYADQLVYHPNKPDTLVVTGGYATPEAWATGSAKSAIYHTDNGGDNWQQSTSGLPNEIMPSFEAGSIEAAGDQSQIFLGDTDGQVWISTDEGLSWQQIIGNLPWISKCFHADLIHGDLVLRDEDVQISDEMRGKMAAMVDRNG